MLEGYDEDWIYCLTDNYANYTSVPPGKYNFRVKGSNNDGYWNEVGASVVITILPPPWKTWWAYTLYVIIIVWILYTIFRYYLKRQKLLYKLELEHIESEKLKELDKMKSRFFANISHEFRTPLTLILGPVQKLKEKLKDKESEEDLNIMHRNARRLQNLINQLSSLSKFESGQMKLQVKERNIVSLLKGYAQSFESLAKQKEIKLVFNSSEENIPIYVDQDKLEKILFNLLSNAFKFTASGGRIQVFVTPDYPPSRGEIHPQGRRGVKIKVSDTGCGIPSEKLNYIFDRFYQAGETYEKNHEGSGIGMALTKELVVLHHGSISVESEINQGTVFTIHLPVGKDHLKAEEIIKDNDLLLPESPKEVVFIDDSVEDDANINFDNALIDNGKPLVLIVEDNTDLRSYIRSYLIDNYQIIEAIDGEIGLQKAVTKIPDLIISDVMMPRMDGIELCKNIKTDERTSHIPVILLTAKASMEDKLEGLQTGADDFLTKPFDPDELSVRIKNLIEQRKKLQQVFTKNLNSLVQLKDSNVTSMDKKFMKKVVAVIEKNLVDANFSTEQFSQEVAMSRMQLHRKLKALTSQSPGDFIRSIRLNRAAELLKKKTGNIAEVAYGVGFSNPSYFSECFKKQFGKLPSEFKAD